ncbi:unnamed protein product, partial [Phaeothamnion confervicola]
GLRRQVTLGDWGQSAIPHDVPPASRPGARARWRAWLSYKGTTKADAMQMFVREVAILEDAAAAAASSSSSGSGGGAIAGVVDGGAIAGVVDGGMIAGGILWKQRDFVKGWRPRHFVLEDAKEGRLVYRINEADATERGCLSLAGARL